MLNGDVGPSEKHLEEWIVNHPRLFSYLCGRTDEWIPIADAIIARQCPLRTGVADLIIRSTWGGGCLSVVELKLGEIDARAIAQIVRYLGDLHDIANTAASTEYAHEHFSGYDRSRFHELAVNGILIGSGIKERDLLWACEALGIRVFIYSYNPKYKGYVFVPIGIKKPIKSMRADSEPATTLLIQSFMDVYHERITQGCVR